jgi:uncharacterized protein YgfB (UPF0149 family)
MILNDTNLILNAGTLAALLIALIVGGLLAADLYNIVHDLTDQSKANGVAINKTLSGIHETYELILKNQKLIINFSDTANHNTQHNLNLTKFNRAVLVDSNNIMREIAKQLNITAEPFNSTKIH